MTGVQAGSAPGGALGPGAAGPFSRFTGARADRYHLLESEMVTLDLADTLFIEHADSRGDRRPGHLDRPVPAHAGWEPDTIPSGSGNLVARALVTVGRSAGVHLVKLIPPGAGFGGGSADAAAVLRWAGSTDLTLAADLGADVPFCLAGGRALVRGIGEAVTPLPYEYEGFTLLLCRWEWAPARCTGHGTVWPVGGAGWREPGQATTWRPPRWRWSLGSGVAGPVRGATGEAPPGRERLHLVRGRFSRGDWVAEDGQSVQLAGERLGGGGACPVSFT